MIQPEQVFHYSVVVKCLMLRKKMMYENVNVST